MITLRRSSERGHVNHGWLDTYHTFSFADYFDRKHMTFRSLRVINEDRVAPAQGFGTHGHRDMEIITYVLEGALEHRDSMGNGSVIRPGDVQRMSAGTGVTHSEFNASEKEPVHLLQIWILPESEGIKPGYEETRVPVEEKLNQFKLIAAPQGGAVKIHQDAKIYASVLETGKMIEMAVTSGRHVWVQVARGAIQVNDQTLNAGDGAGLSNESVLKIRADERAEFLVFDLS